MLKFRKALTGDKNKILKVLKELNLYYPSQSLEDFWVAEKEDEIIGVARLEEYKNWRAKAHRYIFSSASGSVKASPYLPESAI